MSKTYYQRISKGFTLIELMTVIVIVAILMTIALPSYMSFSANNQASDITLMLKRSIQLAKNEAAQRGGVVSICPFNAGGTPSCGSISNWKYGWAVMSVGTILQQYIPNGASGINVSPSGNLPIAFTAQGFLWPTITTFTFTIKPPQCTSGYQLTVGGAGQMTSTQVTCP